MRRLARILIVLVLAAGCSRRPKTADEAYRRFAEAVKSRNAVALFDVLDQESRWSWMTMLRCHREAYDIVLSTYPAEARSRELARFETGATSASAAELFARTTAGAFSGLSSLAGDAGAVRIDTQGDRADAVISSGARVPFLRGEDGRWGFAGFTREAEDLKLRASRDLEVVRASAADYERAAVRAAR